jgi:hypothetical protein
MIFTLKMATAMFAETLGGILTNDTAKTRKPI